MVGFLSEVKKNRLKAGKQKARQTCRLAGLLGAGASL
jgi:hypothetical protein